VPGAIRRAAARDQRAVDVEEDRLRHRWSQPSSR
jgi:hypothetical protein